MATMWTRADAKGSFPMPPVAGRYRVIVRERIGYDGLGDALECNAQMQLLRFATGEVLPRWVLESRGNLRFQLEAWRDLTNEESVHG